MDADEDLSCGDYVVDENGDGCPNYDENGDECWWSPRKKRGRQSASRQGKQGKAKAICIRKNELCNSRARSPSVAPVER